MVALQFGLTDGVGNGMPPTLSRFVSRRRNVVMRHFAAALLPLLIVAVGGCLPSRPAFETTVFDVRRPPPGSSVDDGVQIDVAFVERPVGDRFLNQGLWEFADEQGVNFERKPILEDNGFRAGQVGGQPPPGLQALLNSARTCIEPHRRYLHAGKPATIELGRAWSHCSFTLRQDGRETPVVLDGARCTLEVLPTLTDDGRTTLRFTPVVKHGQKTMEPKVVKTKSGEHNWEMMESEPAETYEWMSWEMTAAPNEFLVIGAALEPYDSLARRSFVYDEGAPRVQRLLVIRTWRAPLEKSADASTGRVAPLAMQAGWTTARGALP